MFGYFSESSIAFEEHKQYPKDEFTVNIPTYCTQMKSELGKLITLDTFV